jgi:ornithine cyclodeaminase
MRVISAEEIAEVLTFPDLIQALDDAFRAEIETPLRHHHVIARPGEPDAMLLLMPAWERGRAASPGGGDDPGGDAVHPGDDAIFMGVKVVSVFPGNVGRMCPTVLGAYLLLDGATGAPLAALDGRTLTLWRTAAASALAASRLARRDARSMLMVGAGALAPDLIRAHASVRPLAELRLWNRTPETAAQLAAGLAGTGLPVAAVTDLAAAVAEADVVSCATLVREPLIRGAWLKPGAHLDLVGGFTPEMREADDEAVRRARLFCDTRAGALHEAGDLADPLARGLISEGDVADLFDLARGRSPGRMRDDEITLFKSVGTALEDLAAAALVWRRLQMSCASGHRG